MASSINAFNVVFKTKIVWNGPQVKKAVKEATVKPLLKCGLLVEREAKLSMRKGGAVGKGARGPGGKFKKMRRAASAPGTPPNVQSGNLRGAITTAQDEKTGQVFVGATRQAWYGKLHEAGGEFGGRNFPRRPFMVPALMKVKAQFPILFRDLPLRATASGIRLK